MPHKIFDFQPHQAGNDVPHVPNAPNTETNEKERAATALPLGFDPRHVTRPGSADIQWGPRLGPVPGSRYWPSPGQVA
jgi:hypothetical protein